MLRSSAFGAIARSARAFSTTPARAYDVARVTLVGTLVRDPEIKSSKNGKDYLAYTVATQQFPPPPVGEDGTRPQGRTNWHRVLCFVPSMHERLLNLTKGTRVFVEASLDVREPVADAEPGSFDAQRHVMLRHDFLRVIGLPRQNKGEDAE
ncbi:hypothetical protein BOTBODRAFT_187771 [Botryobasidium botryosum FD-172 SS1]|uniref:Single-stranded DNA-binding protein n=1 Tax=Botryobasidium botryosum (strain FD-172 SS1) TaxID=930990 RepID=A0A067MGX8_BOTB1|nr:hypothetical protein BOTBODRAFT_187771 [Botryobasidium botryosum FD-172 SS1]